MLFILKYIWSHEAVRSELGELGDGEAGESVVVATDCSVWRCICNQKKTKIK